MSAKRISVLQEFATGIPTPAVSDDYDGISREEVAIALGTSSESIRQTEDRGVRWLWRASLRQHPPDTSCNCAHCQRVRAVERARAAASIGGAT